MRTSLLAPWILVFAAVVLTPATAAAQSSISGDVKDTTGAVLPGVTVEAASPVLIERVRTAITDSQGRYTIVDLRPGTYTVTFDLVGFTKVVRDKLELPANFTATVNTELRIGGLEETVTVSGASPVVDVQQAARTQVLSRDVIDALPTTRNMMSFGSMVPGVKLQRPDVGGSQGMEQTAMRTHGASEAHTTMQIDGMMVNSSMGDGVIQAYLDDALNAEVSVTTSAIPAEVSAGGVRVNAIPKDGGNIFSGAVFLGGTAESWQSNNLDDELRARGVRTPTGVQHVQDFNGSLGGPVLQDRLWFFSSARHVSVNEKVANVTLPDGTPAIVDQYVRDVLARLTWQANSNTKVAAYLERIWKFKGREFTPGIEPLRASGHRNPKHALYAVGQMKLTSTLTSRLMLEAGYSFNIERLTITYQPGVAKERGTAEWYANAQRYDFVRNTRTTAYTQEQGIYPDRFVPSFALSYVTGTHNFKTGMQWSFGQDGNTRSANADLIQRYRDGVPDSVDAYNTPNSAYAYVNYDLGIYVQDSWRYKRLTLNPGVRFELFNAEMQEARVPAGRFVPDRFFPRQSNLPNWRDVAPRFSAVYDLFGDGSTALKGSFSRYFRPWSGGFAKRYNAAVADFDRRAWSDCDLIAGTGTCSTLRLPTNGDDIAQDNEIGPSTNLRFGTAQSRRPAEDLRREYNDEYTVSMQRQLLPGISATVAYFRRNFNNLEVGYTGGATPAGYNLLINSATDYVPFQVANPMNPSEMITVYNLRRDKQGLVDIEDRSSDLNEQLFNGFEVSFSGRLPQGGILFGGWTVDQNIAATCDFQNPNGSNTGTDLFTRRTVFQGGRYCDQRDLGMPFRHDFKIAGHYPLPKGFEAAASLMSYAGNELNVFWTPAPALFPGGRTNVEVVQLNQPGTKYLPRWNQLDVNVKKHLRLGRRSLTGQIDVFNVLNANAVLTQNENFGSALDQPETILQARMVRLVFQMKF